MFEASSTGEEMAQQAIIVIAATMPLWPAGDAPRTVDEAETTYRDTQLTITLQPYRNAQGGEWIEVEVMTEAAVVLHAATGLTWPGTRHLPDAQTLAAAVQTTVFHPGPWCAHLATLATRAAAVLLQRELPSNP